MPIKKPSQGHLSVVRKHKDKEKQDNKGKRNKRKTIEWAELLQKGGVTRSGLDQDLVDDDRSPAMRNPEMTVLGQGPPEESWDHPPNGAIYVEEDSADVHLHVTNLGWVHLNSWCPDVGEEDPCEENPEDPMSGDMYLNILTSDLYYFVEGFVYLKKNLLKQISLK